MTEIGIWQKLIRGFGANIDTPFRRKSDLQAGPAQVLLLVYSVERRTETATTPPNEKN